MKPVIQHKNNIVSIDNTPLVANRVAETYLTADRESGQTTITVANILGFAVNQVLLIGELGSENAEIIKTHASTAPSGTTVTLASSTVKNHYSGDKVYVIQYDQVEISHASTATGSKSVLTTASIDPTEKVQRYKDVSQSSGFYFARYKETIGGTFGGYTDALAYGGWDENTVGYMIHRALHRLGITLNDKVTYEYCIEDGINEGLRLIQGKQIRFPDHYAFDYVLGQTTYGLNSVALPTNIYDDTSNKSIIGFRIGRSENLTYESPQYFAERLKGTAYTQVRTQATSGATTLEIDNSYDFESSGTVNVYVSGTKYSITYTGVTRSATAGILTGIPASGTGSITVTIPVDTPVWQGQIEGLPSVFTVRNGNIEWWYLADSTTANKNIYLDYSKVATNVDSDGDTIDFQRFDMLLDYLTWKIWVLARNRGEADMNNGYYVSFREKLNDTVRTLGRGVVFKMSPKINRIQWQRRPR